MSIIQSLVKLVDPIQARAEEQKRRRELEEPKREHDGDPPRFECRVCGQVGDDKAYCPECLADTMEPVR